MNTHKDCIIEYMKSTGDLTLAEAQRAYAYYMKHNLITYGHGGNGWNFTHGALGDRESLRKSVELELDH